MFSLSEEIEYGILDENSEEAEVKGTLITNIHVLLSSQSASSQEEGIRLLLEYIGESVFEEWYNKNWDEIKAMREYDAYMETLCHATYITGPSHDPYSTCCDLKKNHAGLHEGGDPFGGDQRVKWGGGEDCGGDRLPYHNVEYIEMV